MLHHFVLTTGEQAAIRYSILTDMNLINETNIRQLAYRAGQETSLAIQKHWLKTALLGAAAYMALQKDMVIEQVRLLEKTGGKSGHFKAE